MRNTVHVILPVLERPSRIMEKGGLTRRGNRRLSLFSVQDSEARAVTCMDASVLSTQSMRLTASDTPRVYCWRPGFRFQGSSTCVHNGSATVPGRQRDDLLLLRRQLEREVHLGVLQPPQHAAQNLQYNHVGGTCGQFMWAESTASLPGRPTAPSACCS